MKKNPNSVTMFGANHNGSSSTNAFHYSHSQQNIPRIRALLAAYIMFEDVVRDEGFVDAGVLVRLQMNQRLFGDALMRGFL